MKARSDVLVVIPAFNEEATVAQVVRGVREAGFPVLVVDDGSHDQTSQRARLAGARVVRLPINLGVGGALRCGFRWALKNGYSAVVQCDADGQHPPHQIESLVNFAETNDLHLAIGSRFLGNSEFTSSSIRRIPMRLMAIFASKSAGVQLTDTSSGFRVIRGSLLHEFARQFPVHYLGDTFDVTVEAGRSRFRIGETPVSMHERGGGVPSSNTLWSIAYLLRSLAVLVIGSVNHYRLPREDQ
jgi:glycosyltransferase involved in cell wall biosynthesis